MPPETRTRTRSVDAPATAFLQALPRVAHWLPRGLVAATFLFHGLSKFATIDEFSAMMDLPKALTFIVGYAEASAAILLFAGGFQSNYSDLATRAAGLIVMVVMAGAIMLYHFPRWTFVPDADAGFPLGGMEFQVTVLAVGLHFLMRGAPARA